MVSYYSGLFKNLSQLPPQRSQDHHIHLQTRAQPISVIPYKYPQLQKDEIEKLVKKNVKTRNNKGQVEIRKRMVNMNVWIIGH